MLLLFKLTKYGIRYGVFTNDAEPVYEHFCAVSDWSNRGLSQVFQSDVLGQLRAHGKVFTKVAIVFPFADPQYVEPEHAHRKLIDSQSRTSLLKAYFKNYEILLALLQKNWPHLPILWLFDTYLSQNIDRVIAVPPLAPDAVKNGHVAPRLLNSYAHKSNMLESGEKRAYISLVLEDTTSIALVDGPKIIDVIPAYSPFPQLIGIGYGGLADFGLSEQLTESAGLSNIFNFIERSTGLFTMVNQPTDFESLLGASGLVPRRASTSLSDAPIETLESLELQMRMYIKGIRSAIATLLVGSLEARTVLVSSSYIPESSAFWNLLNQGGLNHLKIKVNSRSSLQAAATDLITDD